MHLPLRARFAVRFVPQLGRLGCAALAVLLLGLAPARGAEPALAPQALYDQLRAFRLQGEAARVENLQFKRDRAQMTLTGDIYFAEPIAGQVYSAVFLGDGRLTLEPWSAFEKGSVQRFLKSDAVDATFRQAVMRFSGDEYQLLRSSAASSGAQADLANRIAQELEERLEKQTGLNLSARLAAAIANRDQPGVFFAEFDRGAQGRFSLLIDHQCRALENAFGLDGGEKGLLFQYSRNQFGNDYWTAFYDEEDFQRGSVFYSESFAIVEIPQYRMEVDLLDPGRRLHLKVEMDLAALREGVVMIPMKLNESLSEYDNSRLKKSLRVTSAALADGAPAQVIQNPWESGFSLILPRPLALGEKATVVLQLESRDFLWSWERNFHYPISNTVWYPRHGREYSRFDVTFRHREKTLVAAAGERTQEAPDPENPRQMVTRWVTPWPVQFNTFALGQFQRHTENATVAGKEVPIEYYSAPGGIAAIKESFLLAELINGVHFFSAHFGDYAYPRLGAVFSPRPFGQGFPTLLLLPSSGRASTYQFAFLSHEGAHQWWGNMVSWQSYRDQWLSEGFAEYSGVLYTGRRDGHKRALDLVRDLRRSLDEPPGTDTGIARGKIHDIGPLIMGHRLSTRLTYGGYTTLIYNKGALVLRMLHFLMTDPQTGNGEPFFDMMREFVREHRHAKASTESFMAIASRHFANSPIGKRYNLTDLNWFFQQWVYGAERPTYRLEYKVENTAEGVMLTGTLHQSGVSDQWFMPLPLVMEFGGGAAAGIIHALGPQTPVRIRLPAMPKSIKLDPDLWVLSERTTEARMR